MDDKPKPRLTLTEVAKPKGKPKQAGKPKEAPDKKANK